MPEQKAIAGGVEMLTQANSPLQSINEEDRTIECVFSTGQLVLGGRWPAAGQFKLAEGQEIALQPGDIVMVGDPQKLEDGSQTAEPLQRKGKGKAKTDEADAE